MTVPVITPAVLVSHRDALSERLDRRATAVMARGRLRSELRSIVLDVLGLSEPGELPAEMAAYVEGATEAAVSAVCDTSMSALLESVQTTIAEAPSSVVARLEQAAVRHDSGFD